MARAPNGRIVAAAGAASGSPHAANKGLSRSVEAAMSQAVTDALAEGITDPDVHRERMLAARDHVKAEFARAAAEAAAAANEADAT
jgi:hypothetical protein